MVLQVGVGREALSADGALVRPLPGVGAAVHLEDVGRGEPLPTGGKVAMEGPFPGVGAGVLVQVAA